MIEHGALTDLLLTHLETESGQLVGDGIAPAEGGWADGQPNKGIFVPYMVAVSSGATVEINDMAYAIDWRVNWSLRSFGGSRKQADWIATKSRNAVEGLLHSTFGTDDPYKIIGVAWSALGPVTRIDTVNPPFWQTFDSFGFICSRVQLG